jgi:hypothetical protein
MMQERERQRLDDQREAVGEIIAGTAIEPHLRARLAGNDAEAVVLDLVQPLAAGRQLVGFGWEARRAEPGREGMRKQIELGRDDCNSAEPGDKCGVDQLAMTGRPSVVASPGPSNTPVLASEVPNG